MYLVRSSVCGLTGFLFVLRFVFSPAWNNPSESLERNGSILALNSRFLVKYELVSSLKRATGGNQWFAHICNFPSGVHVAPSARFDSEPPLPVLLCV